METSCLFSKSKGTKFLRLDTLYHSDTVHTQKTTNTMNNCEYLKFSRYINSTYINKKTYFKFGACLGLHRTDK